MGGIGAEVVVCALAGQSGATYVQVSGATVSCGTDADGNALALQVSTTLVSVSASDASDSLNAVQVGTDIGMAMLLLFAVAWGIRQVRNMLGSSPDF